MRSNRPTKPWPICAPESCWEPQCWSLELPLGKPGPVGHKSDERCIYDDRAKRELVEYFHEADVSVAKLAGDCRVNANLLTTWIRGKMHAKVAAAAVDLVETPVTKAAFMPVPVEMPAVQPPLDVTMSVQAQLPNGVVLDLGGCDLEQASKLVEALGRVRCSASTKS